MPNRIYLPVEVLQAIREHVKEAVEKAESGYSSAQEEEDTLTGELGGALRTKGVRIVHVTEGEIQGPWKWSIDYAKFRSKAKDATESIVGADGILELAVDNGGQHQQKSALFQAKNSRRRDPNLEVQCAKMSVWREASFVINYSSKGYSAYHIDDVLLSQGSIARAENGVPLAPWITNIFIGCRIGHSGLYYDREERRLYWLRQKNHKSEYEPDRWVWVDFKPRYMLSVKVSSPHWWMSRALEISPKKINLSRLAVTPEDIFGIEDQFTAGDLKRKWGELLHVYHSDKKSHLASDIRSLLDSRVIEINNAYEILKARAEKASAEKQGAGGESTNSLEAPKAVTFDEFVGEIKVPEKVKVERGKKKSPKAREF